MDDAAKHIPVHITSAERHFWFWKLTILYPTIAAPTKSKRQIHKPWQARPARRHEAWFGSWRERGWFCFVVLQDSGVLPTLTVSYPTIWVDSRLCSPQFTKWLL